MRELARVRNVVIAIFIVTVCIGISSILLGVFGTGAQTKENVLDKTTPTGTYGEETRGIEEMLEFAKAQAGSVFVQVLFDSTQSQGPQGAFPVYRNQGFLLNPETVVFTKHQYELDGKMGVVQRADWYFGAYHRGEIYALKDPKISEKDFVQFAIKEKQILPFRRHDIAPIVSFPLYEGRLEDLEAIYVIGDIGGSSFVKRGKIASLEEATSMEMKALYPMVLVLEPYQVVRGESGSPVLGVQEGTLYFLGVISRVSIFFPGVAIFERIRKEDFLQESRVPKIREVRINGVLIELEAKER